MRRLLALLLAACVLGACSKSANNYGSGTEAAFRETCTVNQQQPLQICNCIYDEIKQQIPFSRYVELDKQMQTDEKFVPDELISIVADCETQLTTTTTEATTSTSAPESTTTTSTSSSSGSTSSSSSSSSAAAPPIGF